VGDSPPSQVNSRSVSRSDYKSLEAGPHALQPHSDHGAGRDGRMAKRSCGAMYVGGTPDRAIVGGHHFSFKKWDPANA